MFYGWVGGLASITPAEPLPYLPGHPATAAPGGLAASHSAIYSRARTAGRRFATPPIAQNAPSAIRAASPLPSASAAPTIGITIIGTALAPSWSTVIGASGRCGKRRCASSIITAYGVEN